MGYRNFFPMSISCLILLSGPVNSQTLDDARTAIRTRDYDSAIDIYQGLAQSGDSEAAYLLASMYRVGRGVDKDIELANEWMLKAANAGDARAQYSMGQSLLSTNESQEDLEAARAWFEMAALQSHNMAAESLQNLNQPGGPAVTGISADQRKRMLSQAIRQGDIEMVRSLLEAGNVQNSDVTGLQTFLLEAIVAGYANIVAILMQNGADPDGSNDGDTVGGRAIPLHSAVRSEEPEIVSLLLSAGADLEKKDEAGNTALIIAASKGDDEMVLTLLAAGASVRSVDNRGWTALTAARLKNNQITEQILLDYDATDPLTTGERRRTDDSHKIPDMKEDAGWTPLMYAAWLGDSQAVTRILKEQTDIDATDIDGHTALSRAAWRGHVDITNALLAAGSNPDTPQNNGYTPMLWATHYGHLEVIRSLAAAQASLYNTVPANGYSPLMLACYRQDPDSTLLLLELGADINWRSPSGQTAAMVAATGESAELLRLVLASGADLEVTDERGQTAIWHAINSGRHRNLSILLESHASGETRDNLNQHPLIHAIRKGDTISVETLIRHGVRADVKSSLGNSALSVAATIGQVEIMRLLLNAGANPDLQDQQGQSALIRAAITDQREAVVLLLEADANVRLVDRNHKTAKDWAQETGNLQTFALLDQYNSQ